MSHIFILCRYFFKSIFNQGDDAATATTWISLQFGCCSTSDMARLLEATKKVFLKTFDGKVVVDDDATHDE